ncbi:MAG: type II toxin-antitoxin system RelE/ParE family toxin [Planctomycetes bacterium]|nr:type II toxin-antitoxin system RelE/ParE family toxin [Planctomycetota bacterium]
MSLPVIVRPSAEADIRETYQAYELIRPGLGERFASRVREVLERIEFMPAMYGVIWQDVHAARLNRFRQVVYYVVFDDRIEVLAIMHGARDASAWQSRV